MIHANLGKEQLSHLLSEWGRDLMRLRQVLSRLQALLPDRFRSTVDQKRRAGSGKNAQRRALLDPSFLGYLDEVNDISYSVTKTKVEWDTHKMLFQCRQTKRNFPQS